MQIKELLRDNHFETGFSVLGISPVKDKRNYSMIMDYNKNAKNPVGKAWEMAQWWTNYPLKNSTYKFYEGKHQYTTPSRFISIDNKNGELYTKLLASKEYKEGYRKSNSEPWSHLLIEQDFSRSYGLDKLDKLVVNLDFNIINVIDKMPHNYDPNLHAAQFLWYFVVADVSGNFVNYGNAENFFWFGVPIFDNRNDFIPEVMHIDQGGEGTTGKLIYSMPSDLYIKEKIEFNKEYNINYDILPNIKKALNYAKENKHLKVNEDSRFEIVYMNFGWECPGSFDVESYIKNMSVKAFIKNKKGE